MTLSDLSRMQQTLHATTADLYAQRAALILRARAEGHSWADIATALDMTVHGAIKASKMT